MTEYGIADLRGQTDSEVIARLLAVSDSRFQQGLLEQAKSAGKLHKGFELDARFADNTRNALRRSGRSMHGCSPSIRWYGLHCRRAGPVAGAELVEEQVQVERGAGAGQGRAGCAGAGGYEQHLERMGLDAPQGLKEELYQRLLLAGWRLPDELPGLLCSHRRQASLYG